MWPYTTNELEFFNRGAKASLSQVKKETKEMTNFNIDTITSEYAKNAKTVLGFVPSKDVKILLEKVIDLQVEATKLFADTLTDSFKKLATTGK
jgi:hypothetical protein